MLASKGIKLAKVQLNGRYHNKKHGGSLEQLLRLCRSEPSIRFDTNIGPLGPLRNNTTGRPLTSEDQLHEVCLRCLLVEPANWYSTMSHAIAPFIRATPKESTVLELGLVSCIPRSLATSPLLHVIPASLPTAEPLCKQPQYNYPENAIAVVGAACKYPGADSFDQLWDLIDAGVSMNGKLVDNRFNPKGTQRGAPQDGGFLGNFVTGVDRFDRTLFGISPREATYMDPQQRIALQVAYQAIESSGYFGQGSPTKDVGCYMGVASSDYEGNVNTHAPTAFSFTGTARAFVSGRISHYFKWTGPSITVDTACSSSAMAIHQACRDIASGDCTMALAGGINIISGPNTHQNLAAGNFLNTTGPCRSFDSRANGYCRSEGCGFVVLKTLSSAMADNDNILGVIAATATNQSDGSSSIAVPVSRSQTELYQRVLSRAAMSPNRFSYVEAHGTGTPRGDPIEYQSISEVFSGDEDDKSKARNVHLGSIKANIGHAEGASGVASILKVLLMMQQGRIPPQANFSNLNPAMEPGRVEIATKSRDWDVDFRAACVNNFGAAGNNTAIVLCQPPKTETSIRKETPSLHSYPFLLSAQSTASLEGYTTALRYFVNTRTPSLPDLAYNLAQKQNRTLRHRAIFHAGSVEELKSLLNDNASLLGNASSSSIGLGGKAKPVVLVFGGQTGSTVHLSKKAYDESSLLRSHIDQCDAVLQEMGLPSVFPVIFSQEPIQDVVLLHSLLFSVQYACAMAWIGSGVPVQRVVGHSFGQFTAMCVSGVVTLPDCVKLVAGRATLMKERWGGDKGCMLVVEIDREGAYSLTRSSNHTLEIACCNGPYSHVFVGKEPAIQDLESQLSGVKTRKLNTTHGFHSEMVECIMGRFSELTNSVKYATPTIPIETCSETSSWERFTPELVADHSRKTVYFHDAIKRIEQQLGSCVWLEGGSGSIGSMLAKIALRGSDLSKHSFLGLQLGSSDPLGSLVDTTTQLWNEGVPVQFWLYHPNEKLLYSSFPVPGYQFNETSHWIPFVEREEKKCSADTEEALIFLANLPNPESHVANFVVNQAHPDWEAFMKGREVLGGALCPLSVYIELASRAASLLVPGLPPMFRRVSVDNLEIQLPLGRKAVPRLTLKLEQQKQWTWAFVLENDSGERLTRHATGTVVVADQRTPKTEREGVVGDWVEYGHCQNLLHDEATLSIQGNLVYKLLQKVADYNGAYKGIRSIAIKDHEAVAHVEMPPAARHYVGQTSCNPPLADQFALVAEIHALSMENCKRSEVFVCAGLGEVATFDSLQSQTGGPWTVYTRQSPGNDHREILCDTFVFDTATGSLVATATGARFVKTSILALQRVIERANTDQFIAEQDRAVELRPLCSKDTSATSSPGSQQASEVWSRTAQLVHDLTGFPPEQLSASTSLADIGLDSLAATELESKIKDVFRVDLPIHTSDRHREFGSLYDDIRAHGTSSRLGQGVITPDSSESSSSSSVSDQERDQATSDTMDRLMGLIVEHMGEADTVLLPGTELRSVGLDSLLALELESELLEAFGVQVDIMHLDPAFTINDLHDLFSKPCQRRAPPEADARPANFVDEAAVRFAGTRAEASACAQEAGFAGFYNQVYPMQMSLVLAYVVEAFAALGCDLRTILPGHPVPAVLHHPKHDKVVAYYYNLLHDTGLITQTSEGTARSSMPINLPEPTALHDEVIDRFAQHRSEHTLLQRTGARLADCLSGKADALQLLFRDKSTGDLLQDVYTNSPMFKTGTLLLGRFLAQQALTSNTSPGGTDGVFRILELGAGTGGTTKYLLDQLIASGINFRYTFTDISPALIARARKTFAMYDCLDYMTLDVEQPAPPPLTQSFDLIISSNCVHATKDLGRSCKCTFDLLRPKGMLCLLELTRDLPWLDCTFGLLDGWWRFEDGRQHVLANEKLWKGVLEGAGFGYVDWSDDETRESDVFRLIMALKG